MCARVSDTHPEAERVHVALLRRASVARRAQMTRSLSDTVGRMSWQGLRERHPQESDREIGLRFVALTYGEPLAEKLRAFLERRRT